jgi:hypothetical protein
MVLSRLSIQEAARPVTERIGLPKALQALVDSHLNPLLCETVVVVVMVMMMVVFNYHDLRLRRYRCREAEDENDPKQNLFHSLIGYALSPWCMVPMIQVIR